MATSTSTLALLSAARFLEWMIRMNILGYLSQTLIKYDVYEDNLGTYQALIYNVHAGALVLGNCFYGLLLDHFNTKNILLFACINLGAASIAFGLSIGPVTMLVLRFFVGFLDGIDISLRVYIKELEINDKGLVIVFAAPISAAIALAPVLGSVLALPVQQYPSVFNGSFILDYMPTLLPNVILGGLLLVLSLAGYYLLPTKKNDKSNFMKTPSEQYTLLQRTDSDSDELESDAPIMTIKPSPSNFNTPTKQSNYELTLKERMKQLLCKDFILACITLMGFWGGINSFFTLFSLWIGSPEEMAGKGYSPVETTQIYFWPGSFAFVLDILIVGSVNTRLRPRRAFAFWSILKMFSMCLTIVLGNIRNRLLFAIMMTVGLTVARTCTSGCEATSLSIVNNAAPNSILGMANAFAVTLASLSQVAITTILGRLYIWSLGNELWRGDNALGFPLNHYFAFYLASILTAMAGVSSIYMSDRIDFYN